MASFFSSLDEKTLADIIANQRKREEKAKTGKAEKPGLMYDGHRLTFRDLPGGTVIDSDPPLVTDVKGENSSG
jgi:hypothetical protein